MFRTDTLLQSSEQKGEPSNKPPRIFDRNLILDGALLGLLSNSKDGGSK
jgi:hypothetical protein